MRLVLAGRRNAAVVQQTATAAARTVQRCRAAVTDGAPVRSGGTLTPNGTVPCSPW
jgi:hypothetical protein